MKDIIEVEGNWKTFYEAKPSDTLLLLHATSLENAKKIVRSGFHTEEKNWTDSEHGYVYLAGSRYNLGTYLHHTENAIIRVLVRKEYLLPDDRSVDWKEYVKLNRKELKREGVNTKAPTAFDTFKHIGQVKVEIANLKIIDFIKIQ